MVNDTRAPQKANLDGNGNSKVRQSSNKASDISGLRRSTRETVLKNSSTRKPEGLEKQTSVTPPFKKKAEKQRMRSPLRRSERGKQLSSSSPVGPKEVNNSEKHDITPLKIKKRKFDARAYKALFFKKPKVQVAGSTQFDDNNECKERKGKLAETTKDHDVEVSHSSLNPNVTKEGNVSEDGDVLEFCTPGKSGDDSILHGGISKVIHDDAKKVLVDCVETVNLQNSDLIDGCALDLTPLQTKRNTEDTTNEILTAVVDAATSSPCTRKTDCLVETCCRCMKSQRTDVNLTMLKSCSCNTEVNQKLCNATNAILDSSEHEASTTAGPAEKSNSCTDKLKERLSRYTVQELKSEPRFLEFWVPVPLSDMQLEEYCATLLSSSMALRSSLKNDQIDALHDVLINTRKCCDHPYSVDPSLQSLLMKDLQVTEYLDVGIKASGKLQILDSMLSVVKKKGLRALIIFQPIAGKDSITIGDILDDFLRQRFGEDSYERVDGGVIPSRKQSALSAFNKKGSGRFVFLLETRACLPSIKLSSVDIVIIFDSDWNPVSDIRALQKITLDLRVEQIKVFRFFTSCTLEEKVLVRAKKELVDGNFLNLSQTASHQLLMWGASYLFRKLDEFHCNYASGSRASSFDDQSLYKNVNEEFLTILAENCKNNGIGKSSYILRVENNGATYSTNGPLLGELKIQFADDEPPHMFWTHLLECKNPQWKYASVSSQRNRKRVQYFDEPPKNLDVGRNEVVQKQKRVVNNSMDPPLSGQDERKIFPGNKEGADGTEDTPHAEQSVCEIQVAGCEERRKVREAQKSLFFLMKPETLRLCEILQFGEDAKNTVEKFLEYVMNDHQVPQGQASVLQAFQIALCWTASSLLKHKIHHKESFALARQHLNFDCTPEEVDHVYSKLQCLKSMFQYSSVAKSGKDLSVFVKEEKLEDLVKRDISKSIKRIQKKVKKQMAKLIGKQQEEVRDLYKKFAEEKEQLQKKHKAESAVVCHYVNNESAKIDKLSKLTHAYAKEIEEQEQKKGIHLKELAEKHMAARDKDHQRADRWVEDLKSWARDVLLEKLHMDDVGGTVPIGASGSTAEQHNSINSSAKDIEYSVNPYSEDDGLEHTSSCAYTTRKQISQGCMLDKSDRDVSLDMPETVSSTKVTGNLPTSLEHAPDISLQFAAGDGSLCLPETVSSIKDLDNVNLPTSQSNELILDGEVPLRVPELPSSVDSAEKGISVNPPSSHTHTLDVNSLSIPDEYVQVHDGDELIVLENEDSFEIPVSAPNEVLSRIPSELPETATSSNCSWNTVSLSPRAFEEQTPEARLSMPDGEAPLGRPEDSHSKLLGGGNINVENDGRNPVSSDMLNDNVVNQQDGEGNTFSQEDLHLPEPSLMNPPSMQPVCLPQVDLSPLTSMPQVDSLPLNQGLGDRSSVTPTFNGVLGSEVAAVQSTPRVAPSSSAPHEHSQWRPQHAAPVAARMHLPFGPDPLQNELERLRKEMEQTIKIHEDTRLQLRSDCDKEIEELVAQIRKKYETKLLDVDNEFVLKKKTLEANIYKVHMNKILAETFRSKCMDRAAIASGHDVTATFRQQLAQLSMQQNVQRPVAAMQQNVQRPVAADTAVSVLPAVIPQSASHVLPAVIPQSASHLPSISRNPNFLERPSIFISTPARPPIISPMGPPPTCSVPVGSEIRAPAPHLQPFRPLMCVMPSLQGANNLLPIPPSPPLSLPRSSPPPIYESVLNNRMHRAEGARGLAASLPFSSLSAMELLIDVDNRPGASSLCILNSTTNFDQLNHFPSPVMSRTQSSGTENIVYLSDDD